MPVLYLPIQRARRRTIDPALTYDQFWLNYLKAHSRWRTRAIHACGITIIVIGLAAAVWLGSFWLGAGAVMAGYVIAWAAHFTVEENVPVMFASPKAAVWSLVSGLRMYVLFLTARLGPELRRAGVKRGARKA